MNACGFDAEPLPTASLPVVLNEKRMQIEAMNPQHSDVLVIGAGLAGLAAARDLQDAGLNLLMLEKSRGVGGRSATKRFEVNGVHLRADHGAQFFTARGERFQNLISRLEANGVVKEWTRGFPKWTVRGLEARAAGHGRYVAPNGMSALGKAFQEGLDGSRLNIQQNALVSAVFPTHLGWSAVLENGEIHQARALIVNAPAPQALALTRSSLEPQTLAALERVQFNPCWALVVALETKPDLSWVGLEIDHDVLEWAALDSSKRNPGSPPILVLHATPVWSQAHLEQAPETVAALLLEAAQNLLGDWVKPVGMLAHRWRYAKPSITHPASTLEQGNLVFCGDWCVKTNSRIEAALESGWATASHVLERLVAPSLQEKTHVVL